MNTVSIPMRDIDRQIWESELEDFVPSRIYDAHVHLFRAGFDLSPAPDSTGYRLAVRGFAEAGMAVWQAWNAVLFPRREVHGSCMGFPFVQADLWDMNAYVVEEVQKDAGSAAVMLVRPGMKPAEVDAFVRTHGVIGLKPYRLYSATGDVVDCRITDFLPEELIEVAEEHRLVVVLHLARRQAAADEQNLADLRRLSRAYPHVQWQLAHCARCFIPHFMELSIGPLSELDNVWFDTSAVCESDVLDILLRRGPRERVLFGSDSLPAGVDRGKYIAFGYAWALLTEDNQRFDLSHCQPDPTWVVYESLRGLRRTVERLGLTPAEIEDLFIGNAVRLRRLIGRR
ncbi:MAG: amidohydrolase family protein [Anaerolineae bacterium]